MQFNRDKSGQLTPLPRPCVDTGMGLERLAAVLQGVHDNYDIDLFKTLIDFIAKLLNVTDLSHRSLRVIADHIRSTAFLILDGVNPSNEGRGYVLRRIMRRALRHGHKLGANSLFFHPIVEPLCDLMGEAYPEILREKSRIIEVIKQEEIQFSKTLANGVREFEAALLGEKNIDQNKLIGSVVFKLYDTYGFPVDLTEDMAKERGLSLDHDGFNRCMDQQRVRAKEASQFGVDYNADLQSQCSSEFVGYFSGKESTEISEIFHEGGAVDLIKEGQKGVIVLPKTPFYAESGGQIGDVGLIQSDEGDVFEVSDTQKKGEAILHLGVVIKGQFTPNQSVHAEITHDIRADTKRHHSATHLLHAALQSLFGNQIVQKGSLVTPTRLRFDFSYGKAFSEDELSRIEQWVNEKIFANYPVAIIETSKDEAHKMGAMALFGEKYGEKVRVIQMGVSPEKSVSMELCGGTHVSHTGDIGFFKIVSEGAVASGIRRIEAVVGSSAVSYCQHLERSLQECADLLKSPLSQVTEKVKGLLDKTSLLNKQVESLEKKIALSSASSLLGEVEQEGNVQFLAKVVEVDPKNLRELGLFLQEKLPSSVIALGAIHEGRANLMILVSPGLTKTYHAGQLIQEVSPLIQGKGGGKAEMAQASGSDSKGLENALQAVKNRLKS
jgi:alanyl-tRNA synthetase